MGLLVGFTELRNDKFKSITNDLISKQYENFLNIQIEERYDVNEISLISCQHVSISSWTDMIGSVVDRNHFFL